MQRRLTAALLVPVVLSSLAVLSGCGGSGENTTVEDSPAAKKATSEGIDAMREAMRTKNQGGKSAARP